MGEPWTYERKTKLKELWEKGASAAEIACILGGVTRNAVLGAIHRMGFQKPKSARKTSAKSQIPRIILRRSANPPKYYRQPAVKVAPTPAIIPPEPLTGNEVSFAQLKRHHCRYPVNDDQYCGQTKVDNKSYCSYHANVVRRKPNVANN